MEWPFLCPGRRFGTAMGGPKMRTVTRFVGAMVLVAALGAPLLADDQPSERLVAASRLQETGSHREAIALLEEIRQIDPNVPRY